MCKITSAQHFRQQHFNVLVFLTSSLRSKEASSVKIRGRKLKHQVRRDADKSCFTVFVFYLLKQEGTRTILNVSVARWLDEVTKTRVLKQHDLYLNLTDPKHDGCFHKNLYIFTKKPFSTSEWIFSHIINVHLHIWIKCSYMWIRVSTHGNILPGSGSKSPAQTYQSCSRFLLNSILIVSSDPWKWDFNKNLHTRRWFPGILPPISL